MKNKSRRLFSGRRSRKLLLFILILFFATAGVLVWWKVNSKAVSANNSTVHLIIPKGYGAAQVAQKLEEKNLIKSSLAFKIYVQVKGEAKKVKAGEYDIRGNLTLAEITKILLKGPSEVWVTIPEGLRREEIALRFANGFEKEGDERTLFLSEFFGMTQNKEGYLFPDTYLFPYDASADKVVSGMLRNFERRTEKLKERIASTKYGMNQIMTMASLVEREAISDNERPKIAGILLKRLEADWPLQVDAAVQYAVASLRCGVGTVNCENWWPILTKEDIKINSLYNTYKNSGLPPAPISNPGLSSIRAVLYPQATSFWFYLHDANGKIHYARTLEEHNLNVRKYLGK